MKVKIEKFQLDTEALKASKLRPGTVMFSAESKNSYMNGGLLQNSNSDVLPGNSSSSNQILRKDGETLKLYSGNTPITQIMDSQNGAVGGYLWGNMNTDNALMTALNYKNDRAKLQEKIPLTPVSLVLFPTNVDLYVDTYNDFIGGTLGTYTFILPTAPTDSYAHSIIVHFTTGASPSLTINGNGNTISYFDEYTIEANTEYELNIMWNGTKWILAYAVIG